MRRSTVVLVALALAVFGLTASWMRSMEREALRGGAINDQFDPAGNLRPLADVTRAVRELKLVTVVIDTQARSERSDESWRGDVTASVRAPVRLMFGTDLSRLESEAIVYSPVSRAYHVRVPAPTRLSTEVDGGQEQAEVSVGWARLRSRAGEYWLGQARRGLYEEARRLTLSPDDAEEVRRATREQVAAMVRRVVGDVPVTVSFEESPPAVANVVEYGP